MYLDIWQIIMNLCDIKTQLALSSTCKHFYNNLKIYKLICQKINPKFLQTIRCCVLNKIKIVNGSNLKQNDIIGLNLNYFKIGGYPDISDVSFMTHLKYLSCSGFYCKIDQNGICGLNLKTLLAHDNTKITNVCFMKNLKKLDCSGMCGINHEGITGLDLIYINSVGNNKIFDVSWMTNLTFKTLECNRHCIKICRIHCNT